MNLKLQKGDIGHVSVDVAALGLFENEKNNPFLQQCGKEINAEVQTALKTKEFSAEFGEIKSITTLGKIPARKVFVVGLGKRSEFTLEKMRRISANVLKTVKASGAKQYASVLHHAGNFQKDQAVLAAAEGVLLANYGFDRYRTEEKEKLKLKQIDSVVFLEREVSPQLQKALEKANLIAEATNYVRDLVNLPANVLNPEYLAEEALKLKKWMKVTVFDMAQLKKMGCGGIVAVGQGSANEPKLIVLDYNPHAKKSLAIVGKGVTFDSGGLSLKPGKYMETMKQDMAGGATVLGVLKAAAEMKLNVHLMGVIPTVENMPSGKSYRPDDIVTFFNGKTAEIGNTDAEGRVILADGLSYAESLKPQRIIDLATLTGACVVALGYWATGLMTKNDAMAKDLEKAGEETGDRVWRLPFWEEYMENMKSDIADVRNVGKGYDAGTIEGAVFLSHFVKDTPWVHLDIAGTAFWSEPKFYHPKGATGAGVRLLLKYVESL